MRNALLIAALGVIGTLATSSARQFEDTFGRMIEAELLAHWGANTGLVKIKKGGKNLVVEIKNFSGKDQKYILQWITGNPGKLDALVEPPASGSGVLSGSKWFFLHRGRPLQIELKGAGTLAKNGITSKSGRWSTDFQKNLSMRWDGSPVMTFDDAIIANRVYASSRHGFMMIKLDRLPITPTVDSIKGKSYILANLRNLSPWTGDDSRRTAPVEFKDGGKATVAGKEFGWTVAAGVIQLKHASGYASFGACARDIYLDSRNNVLWEVAPPRK